MRWPMRALQPHARPSQRGSALVLALFLIVILTVLGLGLVLRTRVAMTVAGSERSVTKGFYAADSGISTAFAHLQENNPCAFSYTLLDQRGAVQFPITVTVPQSQRVGNPQRAVGSETGGGISGGGTNFVYMTYRLNSSSFEPATQTRRQIEADVSIGPTILAVPVPCL
jgi:PilX N-terminal